MNQINVSLGVLTVQLIIVLCSLTAVSFVGYYSYQNIAGSFRRRRLAALASSASSGNILKDEIIKVDGYTCTVCKIEPRTVLFLPCKHVMYCRDCWAAKPETDKCQCEKCQKNIASTNVIYLT